MAETLYPGIYNVEMPTARSIEGVSVSTGAFVGIAEKGEIGRAVLITSWNDFLNKFGGFLPTSYLAYAVKGFFDNGGTKCYVSRVVKNTNGKPESAKAKVQIGGEENPYLLLEAIYDGEYGNKLSAEIANLSTDKLYFDLIVSLDGVVKETIKAVSLHNIEEKVANESKLISATVVDEDGVVAVGVHKLAEGRDGVLGIASTDYLGDKAKNTGLYAFDNVELNFIAISGVTDVAVVKGLQDYVANRNDCYAILDVPFRSTPETVLKFKNTDANIASKTAGVFYPWIQVADPIGVGKSPSKYVAPSGHVMGVFARTVAERGVWKAPAGLEAKVRGALSVEYIVNDPEQGTLNPEGINVIRAFSGEGIVIWGARNSDKNSDHKYITDTLTMQYVRKSITKGTRWALFEPNDEKLFEKIEAVGQEFLRGLWNAGGLRGTSEDEAFFFVCNSTTTTIEDIQNGITNADWGIATQKPTEFLVYRQSLKK